MNAKELRDRYESGLYMLPAHSIEQVTAYLQEGIEPGGFVLDILTHGPTSEITWLHADVMNRAAYANWRTYFENHMPEKAWGSDLKVKAWMAMRGLDGMPGGK